MSPRRRRRRRKAPGRKPSARNASGAGSRRKPSGRKRTAPPPAGPPPAGPPRGGAERVLRTALFGAIGLLLLTPFVVDTGTVFPFVVGKALWSRSLIEIAFALWAVLALTRPGYRPPRAWILVLLAAGLGVSLLSAWFGVSLQYSLWTSYERMLGVVDQAHWVALAVVLASVVTTPAGWRTLLGAQVAAGAAMALIVIARAVDIEVPFFGGLPELSSVRMGGPLGNPGFLSVYLLANGVLAAGFSARAWIGGARGKRPGAYGWAAIAGLHFIGLLLAGSVGGFAGLLAAAGFAVLGVLWLARGRQRLAAAAAIAVFAVASVGLVSRFIDPASIGAAPFSGSSSQSPLVTSLRYMGRVHLQNSSVQSRLAAWKAGLEGFAQRPLLGWGPGNYTTVFGLFGSGYAATAEPHDQAHGKLVEVAATTGLAGLAAWLALWALALTVLLRYARAAGAAERAFAVFAAAALAGHLVQLQFLFDTAAGSLFATLSAAFAAQLESRALPAAWRPRLPAPLARCCERYAPGAGALMRGAGVRAALGAAALALALTGLAVNRTIFIAADTRHVAPDAIPSGVTAEGIEAFPSLAGFYRRFFFLELERNWAPLHATDPALAEELLEWAGREAEAAVASQPWDWRVERRLARLYRVVADTEPAYEERARRHLARVTELAPVRAVFSAPLEPPSGLSARPLPGGGAELRWNPSPGAGYHQIARSAVPGAWSAVLYSYDPARRTFAAPACAGCAHRIRACRTWNDCSDWAHWP